MARKKKTQQSVGLAEEVKPQEAGEIQPIAESVEHDQPTDESHQNRSAPVESVKADGSARFTQALSGRPTMHLLRSLRFNQMQIRFDQGQPDEQHLAMLKRSGWLDRTEAEGVWTKQIDPNARWQSVDQMEHEFRSIANAIRKDRGLEPALQSLALA
jgi:hypothetical protein